MTAHDKALVDKVTSELGKHHRTRGLAVSMGTTCACGFWEKGRKQTGGSDGLASHRAEVALGVAADDLREQGGAGVRAAVEAVHQPERVNEAHECNEREQYGEECMYAEEPRYVTICSQCGYDGGSEGADEHYPCATLRTALNPEAGAP